MPRLNINKRHYQKSLFYEIFRSKIKVQVFLKKFFRNNLIKEMSLGAIDKDNILFSQGSYGDYFYILKEGEVALYINNKLVKNLLPGDSFGELGK
jgi:CRP-like cAMP-binding protein